MSLVASTIEGQLHLYSVEPIPVAVGGEAPLHYPILQCDLPAKEKDKNTHAGGPVNNAHDSSIFANFCKQNFVSPAKLRPPNHCGTLRTPSLQKQHNQWRVGTGSTVSTAHDTRWHGRRRQARIRVPVHRTCCQHPACKQPSRSWLLQASTVNNYSCACIPATSIPQQARECPHWGWPHPR